MRAMRALRRRTIVAEVVGKRFWERRAAMRKLEWPLPAITHDRGNTRFVPAFKDMASQQHVPVKAAGLTKLGLCST